MASPDLPLAQDVLFDEALLDIASSHSLPRMTTTRALKSRLDPHRVGRALRLELVDHHAARRGDYRLVYRTTVMSVLFSSVHVRTAVRRAGPPR